jgi:bifunctional UDP-N-acetylglucosamine pyrophosphorylase/glucosamine-1-phosphate N-acetyltransferase
VFDALRRVGTDNPQGEYFLTDAIELISREIGRCDAYLSPDARLWLGLNNRVELAEAGSLLRGRILRDLMLSGVTLVDPSAVYIDATVKIGRDTTILPGCILQGETEIGEDCVIGPYALLKDAKIGDGVTVAASQIHGSTMEDGSRIGPWSHVRSGCVIGERARLGNYVELNRTRVESRVAIGHVSYIGDAVIGEETNIGAGLITCNYDGMRKHPTRIGRKAFIGSHNALVAPVTIGDGAYTAAGSVITEDVPPESLALGRARQIVKPDWAAKRREKENP